MEPIRGLLDDHPFVAIFSNFLPVNWISEYLPRELQSDIAAALADTAMHHRQPVNHELSTWMP
jgi:hypothetical protein